MSKRPLQCPNAPRGAVFCETKNCEKCGWNPEVASARLEAIKQKLFEQGVAKYGEGHASKTHH